MNLRKSASQTVQNRLHPATPKVPTEEFEAVRNKLLDDFLLEIKDRPLIATEAILEVADTSHENDPILKLKKMKLLVLLDAREAVLDRFRLGVVSIESLLDIDNQLTKAAIELPLTPEHRLGVLSGGRNRAASLAAMLKVKAEMGARGGETGQLALATVSLFSAEIAYQEELRSQNTFNNRPK